MGVPQFFHWLVTHYSKELLFEEYPHQKLPDILYLDFNCGIHPAVKKKDYDTLDEMYQAVCDYLDRILDNVKPNKMVYIAIDGVAPMGKMKQQRYRRFKTIKERRELDRIDRKHQRYTPAKHDFNMISPGTEFMEGLTARLNLHIATRLAETHPNLKIVLDDASNPGEGEHKITHHIRTQTTDKDSVMVYGLDSDLIFLCLLHYRPDFCLFREKIYFDSNYVPEPDESPFTYLNLTNFRQILLSMMTPKLNRDQLDDWGIMKTSRERLKDYRSSQATDVIVDIDDLDIANDLELDHIRPKQKLLPGETLIGPPPEIKIPKKRPLSKSADELERELRERDLKFFHSQLDLTKTDQQRLIIDYTAICFLLGNDFLPYIPSLKIKDGGLTRLINCYKKTQERLPKKFLVTKNGMDYDPIFLIDLLQVIGEYEDIDLIRQNEASEVRAKKFKYRLYNATDPYQKDRLRWEYIEDQWRDTLKLGEPGWKPRFYHHYIHSIDTENQNRMLKNYLDGLVWNVRYYLGNRAPKNEMIKTCPNWHWKYNYRVSPPASDLYKYLREQTNGYQIDRLAFNTNLPVRTDVQLLMILPPQSVQLLKPPLHRLMLSPDSPLIFQYPIDFEIDQMNHRYRWECYPILPPQNLKKTQLAVDILLDPRLKKFPIIPPTQTDEKPEITQNEKPEIKLKSTEKPKFTFKRRIRLKINNDD